jgi:hypothetical protein
MIENDIKNLWTDLNALTGQVLKLKSDFESKLAVDLDKWREYYSLLPTNNKKPHRCPLCNGVGKVWDIKIDGMPHFGSPSRNCHSCIGSGIVWG